MIGAGKECSLAMSTQEAAMKITKLSNSHNLADTTTTTTVGTGKTLSIPRQSQTASPLSGVETNQQVEKRLNSLPPIDGPMIEDLSQDQANQRIANDQNYINAVNNLSTSTDSMQDAALKLANNVNFSSGTDFAASLQDFANAYNNSRTNAQAIGTDFSKEVSAQLSRVGSLVQQNVAGVSTAADGSLQVDTQQAAAAYDTEAASSRWGGATSENTFSQVVMNDATRPSPDLTGMAYQAQHDIDEIKQTHTEADTRKLSMMTNDTLRLSQTYDPSGQMQAQNGPTQVFKLM